MRIDLLDDHGRIVGTATADSYPVLVDVTAPCVVAAYTIATEPDGPPVARVEIAEAFASLGTMTFTAPEWS